MDEWQCCKSDRCHYCAPKWRGGGSSLVFHTPWAHPLLGRGLPALGRRQGSAGLGCDSPECGSLLCVGTMGGRRPSGHGHGGGTGGATRSWELGGPLKKGGFVLKGLCWRPGAQCPSELGCWLPREDRL